jgi:hypothetical protein
MPTLPEIEARREGRKVARAGSPRTARPHFLTHEERVAFNKGWDDESAKMRKERQVKEMMDELLGRPPSAD